jgi:hypothetical protein
LSDGAKNVVFSGTTPGTGETLGESILDDPTFDDNSKWTKFDGWSVADGKASHTNVAGTYFSIYQTKNSTPGRLVKSVMEVVHTSGDGARSQVPSAPVLYRNTTGTFTQYATNQATGAEDYGCRCYANWVGYILSLYQTPVLTASATGFDATASVDGGVNANVETWTVTITKP